MAPVQERTTTCVNCQKSFTYTYGGMGRGRRYCDTCAQIPPNKKHPTCPICGNPMNQFSTQCEDCRATNALRSLCRRCAKPIPDLYWAGELAPFYCSFNCQRLTHGPTPPICLRTHCNNPVPVPQVPRQYPKYCGELCRQTVYHTANPRMRGYNIHMIAFWNKWRNQWQPPYRLTMLPLGPGTHPQPVYCISADTGITESDLHEDVTAMIMRWTHIVNFCYHPLSQPEHLITPTQSQALFMMTHYAHVSGAWRVWPWIWEQIPPPERPMVRAAWAEYAPHNTISDGARTKVELMMEKVDDQIQSYTVNPPDELLERYEALADKVEATSPFAGLTVMTDVKEIAKKHGNSQAKARIEWIAACEGFAEAAVSIGATAQPSPTASVRAQRSRKQAQSRRAK